VILTPTHLAIVMEYAAGGELFERICKSGRFSEDEVPIQLSLDLFFFVFPFFGSVMVAFFFYGFLTLVSGSGTVLLSTTYIWSQLLSCHGTCSFSFFFCLFIIPRGDRN